MRVVIGDFMASVRFERWPCFLGGTGTPTSASASELEELEFFCKLTGEWRSCLGDEVAGCKA